MKKVVGINNKNMVKTIKVKSMSKREIEKMLRAEGWTCITFLKEQELVK